MREQVQPTKKTALVDAIEAGNVATARKLMLHHLGHSEQRLDLDAPQSRDLDLEEILG